MEILLCIDFSTEDESRKSEIQKLICGPFREASFNYLKANEKRICDSLTGGQAKVFQSALKNKSIKFPLLKTIENSLSGFNEGLTKAIIIDTFGNSVYNTLNDDSLSQEDVANFVASDESISLSKFGELFRLLGFDGSTICNNAKTIRDIDASVKKDYEKKLKEAETKANDLEAENNALSVQIDELRADVKKKAGIIEQKDGEIAKLQGDLSGKASEIEGLKENTKELAKEREELIRKKEAAERFVSTEDFLRTLEEHSFIGGIDRSGINLRIKMVVVSASGPLFPEADYINRGGFEEKVAYGSQQLLTFAHFIDDDLLHRFLPDYADGFFYLSDAEKTRLLMNAFVGKTIVFKPEFKPLPGKSKLVKNAIIQDVVDSTGFDNAIYVPSLSMTAKAFEEAVDSEQIINIPNYPVTLARILRFVLVGRALYQVSLIPNSPKENIHGWRASTKEHSKLATLSELQRSDYLEVRDSKDYFVKYSALTKLVERRTGQGTITESQLIEAVYQKALSKGLVYQKEDIANFHVSLKSSNLVILAGPSGIGKTRLPLVYAETLGLYEENNALLFIPISPSYLEPEDVLGFTRPIPSSYNGSSFFAKGDSIFDDEDDAAEPNAEYFEAPTGLVSFLKEANEHRDKIHIVVFDEMNLSQIEHWFAPFISILEKDSENRKLVLYSNKIVARNAEDYPSSIVVGPNVFFVGTVNIDETTKPISDRLADRAIVINLQKSPFTDLELIGDAKEVEIQEVTFSQFETFLKSGEISSVLSKEERDLFQEINTLLGQAPYSKGISYRTLKKAVAFLANSEGILERGEALDIALDEMVIAKIKGSSIELQNVISSVGTEGLQGILGKHKSISEFLRSINTLRGKAENISIHGYSR